MKYYCFTSIIMSTSLISHEEVRKLTGIHKKISFFIQLVCINHLYFLDFRTIVISKIFLSSWSLQSRRSWRQVLGRGGYGTTNLPKGEPIPGWWEWGPQRVQGKVGGNVKLGDNQCKAGKAVENQQNSDLESGPENEIEGRQPVKNTECSHLQVPWVDWIE